MVFFFVVCFSMKIWKYFTVQLFDELVLQNCMAIKFIHPSNYYFPMKLLERRNAYMLHAL